MKMSLLAAILTATSAMASAENLPDYYPEFFRNSGIVSTIDVGGKTMVVHDMRVDLDNDTKVYTRRSQSASLLNIEPGSLIGYNYRLNKNGRPVAYEVWVLPDGHPTLPLPQ